MSSPCAGTGPRKYAPVCLSAMLAKKSRQSLRFYKNNQSRALSACTPRARPILRLQPRLHSLGSKWEIAKNMTRRRTFLSECGDGLFCFCEHYASRLGSPRATPDQSQHPCGESRRLLQMRHLRRILEGSVLTLKTLDELHPLFTFTKFERAPAVEYVQRLCCKTAPSQPHFFSDSRGSAPAWQVASSLCAGLERLEKSGDAFLEFCEP